MSASLVGSEMCIRDSLPLFTACCNMPSSMSSMRRAQACHCERGASRTPTVGRSRADSQGV
eukprot:12196530-Alexandrium_andersonii.AAC.1